MGQTKNIERNHFTEKGKLILGGTQFCSGSDQWPTEERKPWTEHQDLGIKGHNIKKRSKDHYFRRGGWRKKKNSLRSKKNQFLSGRYCHLTQFQNLGT